MLSRIFLVIVALRTLTELSVQEQVFGLIMVALASMLSLVSWASLRTQGSSPSANEQVFGAIFGLAAAAFSVLILDFTRLNIITLLGSALLLALALIWVLARPATSTLIMQAALASASIFLLTSTLLWGVLDLEVGLGALTVTALILLVTKLWAAWAPRPAQASASFSTHPGVPTATPHPDPLGSWGAEQARPLGLTGLMIAHLPGALAYLTAEDLWVSLLTAVLFTLAWFFYVRPNHRIAILLVGVNSIMFRLLAHSGAHHAIFYLVQSVVFSFALLALLTQRQTLPGFLHTPPHRPMVPSYPPQPAGQTPAPKTGLFWAAFGIQTGFSILFAPFYSPDLTLFEKVLFLGTTALLIGASAVLKKKLPPILSALLLTYQLLLGGLTSWSLFIAGFALIGIVIWRLLARPETPPSQHQAGQDVRPGPQCPDQVQVQAPWQKNN